tara:strand:- start:311 stop:1009 length:699 start_codon:yes stop_codon:yes gene_type:complete
MNALRAKIASLFIKRSFRRFSAFDWKHINPHFSQFGEDASLLHMFLDKKKGFYVDVGAFHPAMHSNTHVFYKNKGWRGINIDPNAEHIKLFEKHRKRDINLHTAISDTEDELTYYRFKEGAINSLSKEYADELIKGGATPLPSEKIKTQRLENVLEKHLPEGQTIDFMSVDCEAHDLKVLKSNDWERFRPTILLVEDHAGKEKSEIAQYCEDIGYEMINWVGLTKFFRDTRA